MSYFWRTFADPGVARFKSNKEYREYMENLMRCGQCHERVMPGEEFGLFPLRTNTTRGMTVQAVIIHKKCYGGDVE